MGNAKITKTNTTYTATKWGKQTNLPTNNNQKKQNKILRECQTSLLRNFHKQIHHLLIFIIISLKI